MTNGYKNKMKKLDEHTNIYLYKEQYKDYHWRLNLMLKQLELDSRLGVLASKVYLMGGLIGMGVAIRTSKET